MKTEINRLNRLRAEQALWRRDLEAYRQQRLALNADVRNVMRRLAVIAAAILVEEQRS